MSQQNTHPPHTKMVSMLADCCLKFPSSIPLSLRLVVVFLHFRPAPSPLSIAPNRFYTHGPLLMPSAAHSQCNDSHNDAHVHGFDLIYPGPSGPSRLLRPGQEIDCYGDGMKSVILMVEMGLLCGFCCCSSSSCHGGGNG
jgi:hypothetical protein